MKFIIKNKKPKEKPELTLELKTQDDIHNKVHLYATRENGAGRTLCTFYMDGETPIMYVFKNAAKELGLEV